MLELEPTTIAAPLTPPGRGAVSVIRVSGPHVVESLHQLIPSKYELLLQQPRLMTYSAIRDIRPCRTAAILDFGLSVYFPAAMSYTGEDVCEFHLHGSPLLVDSLLECLRTLGVRLASPGEFTQRAFLNGKLDLIQAEAVADLISADTESQATVAKRQLAGVLSHAISTIGEPLRDVLAEIEAYIDFPEEDIDALSRDRWKEVFRAVLGEIDRHLQSFAAGRVFREGAHVVVSGVPNAGKSSFINSLLGEERVIVSPYAGTTRDAVEVTLSLDGLCVRLWDTAGLAESLSGRDKQSAAIEQIGIEHAWRRIREADLVVSLFDPTSEKEAQYSVLDTVASVSKRLCIGVSKSDLTTQETIGNSLKELSDRYPRSPVVLFSAMLRSGLDDLCACIKKMLVGDSSPYSSALLCNQRHFEILSLGREALERASESLNFDNPIELTAADLRETLGQLSEIVGATESEEILGRIFSRFCIGK